MEAESYGNCVYFTECPQGTLGRNCSEICPNGTYGFKCVYKCTCMDCDPVTGCLTQDTSAVRETVSVTSTDVLPAEGPVHTDISLVLFMVLLIVILAIVGCNFAATIFLLLRFSITFHISQHQDRRPKESITRGTIEEIEMSPDAYASPL